MVESYKMSVAPSLLADLVEEPTVSWSMPMVLQIVRRPGQLAADQPRSPRVAVVLSAHAMAVARFCAWHRVPDPARARGRARFTPVRAFLTTAPITAPERQARRRSICPPRCVNACLPGAHSAGVIPRRTAARDRDSGRRTASCGRTGMCAPGLNVPCLAGVVSLMNSTRSGVMPKKLIVVVLFDVAP